MKTAQLGLTLLQALITLSILGILSTQALPAMRDLSASNKAVATINQLHQQLNYARSLAVAESRYVSICGYAEGQQCANDWSEGIKIFYDANIDGKQDTDESTAREFRFPADSSSVALNAAFGVSYIRYTPQGTTSGGNGNIVYCSKPGDTAYAKVLIYYLSGRVYVGQDNNNNGIPENGSGDDISC